MSWNSTSHAALSLAVSNRPKDKGAFYVVRGESHRNSLGLYSSLGNKPHNKQERLP